MPFIQDYVPPSGSDGLRGVTRAQASHLHQIYAHKTHYRIIFKEKGIPLDRVKSLPDLMTVLTETVSGVF
jgi:hypothetical protein